MNSQECLYGPGSEFLAQYSHLLRYSTVQYSTVQCCHLPRADLDTFPGPRLLDWWPDTVILDR